MLQKQWKKLSKLNTWHYLSDVNAPRLKGHSLEKTDDSINEI